MLSALEKFAPSGTNWTKPTGGLFVWVELASQIDTTDMLSQAVEQGVAYIPGAPFYVSDAKVNTLRLAFSKETPERITIGIEKLCKMF